MTNATVTTKQTLLQVEVRVRCLRHQFINLNLKHQIQTPYPSLFPTIQICLPSAPRAYLPYNIRVLLEYGCKDKRNDAS